MEGVRTKGDNIDGEGELVVDYFPSDNRFFRNVCATNEESLTVEIEPFSIKREK